MIWLAAILAALALGGGAFLASPAAHPIWGATGSLALAGAAVVLALVAYALGREWITGLAIGAALAATIPPDLPMGWIGPLLLTAGAALSLETTRAREAGALPPATAWALPVGLTIVGLSVPLAALVVQSGRESLDLAQGIGAAVSAPFVLLAAAGLLSLVYSDEEDETSEAASDEAADAANSTVAAVAIVAGLAILLVTAGLVAANTREQQRGMELEVLVDDSGASGRDMTQQTFWAIDNSSVALLLPDTDNLQIRNVTVLEAEFAVNENSLSSPEGSTSCERVVIQLARNVDPWGTGTTWSTLPSTTNPRNRTIDLDQCNQHPAFTWDVTADARAWSRGEPLNGWTLSMPQGDREYDVVIPTYNVTYDPNPPEIAGVETTPDRVPGGVIAPVGQNVTVAVNATDPMGGIRNATLVHDGVQIGSARFPVNTTDTTLTFRARAGMPDAPLVVEVVDWDGNEARKAIGRPILDRLRPNATVEAVPTEPVPRGSTPNATLAFQDDLCEDVTPCLDWSVRNETGHIVANGTGNGTATIQLPTQHAGPRELVVTVTDRAGRTNSTTLSYLVREQVPPGFARLNVLGALERPNLQEQGLPFTVELALDEESPPITVDVFAGSAPVAKRTIDTTQAAFPINVTDTGETTITVRVEDRWGNVAQAQRRVTVEPRSEPIVLLPTRDFVSRQPTLAVQIVDLSVDPLNVTVDATVGGSPLPGMSTNHSVTRTGLDLSVGLPSLVDGERVRLVVQATDALGQSASTSHAYTADAGPPRISVEPSPGIFDDGVLFTTPDGEVTFAASDDVSSVTRFELDGRAIDPRGTDVPAGQLASSFSLIAEDEAGNQATRQGAVSIDGTPPTVEAGIDGHDVVVTVTEQGSGLARSTVTVDGTLHPIPLAPGTHNVTLTDVRRGDEITAEVRAVDRVGQEATVVRNLTVEDAPPRITIGTVDGRNVSLSTSDPDGDTVDTTVTARHAVNGTERTLERTAGRVTLPDWRGEVVLEVAASAHDATTTRMRTLLLGQPPFVSARAPEEATTGREVTVHVEWARRADEITVTALRDGIEVASADVQPTSDGEGTATLTFDESGTYHLDARLVSPDGDVEVQSAGTVSVSTAIGWPIWVLVALGAIGLIGAGVYLWLRRREEPDEGQPEGA